MRMSNINIASRFSDDTFKEKEVERFAQTYPGNIVLKPSYKTEEELDDDWKIFKGMTYDIRLLSNNKALQLYGMKNEELYQKLKHEFLKNDIKNSKILDNKYIPAGLSHNSAYDLEESVDIKKDYKGITIAEHYNPSSLNYAISLIDAIAESDDNIEKLFLFDTLNSIDEDSEVINSLKKYGYKKLEESINPPDPEIEYPMGMNTDSFFTLNELKDYTDNFVSVEDLKRQKNSTPYIWLNNFIARSYGLRPYLGKNGEINMKSPELVPGWNPLLPYTDLNRVRSAERLNYVYGRDIFAKSHFINLFNLKIDSSSLDESDSVYPSIKGISVYFIHGELDDGDNDTPRVAISLDTSSSEVIPILNGELSHPCELKDILNKYEWANIVLFFLPVEDDLYSRLYNNISIILDKQSKPKGNFLKDISDDMDCPNAIVANDKVFYMFLMNSILDLGRSDQNDISSLNLDDRLFWNKKPNYTYILYKGNKDNFNVDDIKAKLNFYSSNSKLSVSPNEINEGYFRMKKTDLQVLNESNEEENIDYLNRIPFKEVSELLNKYSV